MISKFIEMVSDKRFFVHEHKIEEGYVIGTVSMNMSKLEGAGIIKLNNCLV